MRAFVFKHNFVGPRRRKFYRKVFTVLKKSDIPVMVGGALALGCYTGIIRDTKDVDIFIDPKDIVPMLALFDREGFRTELTDIKWLGKAYLKKEFVDIIFGSLNGISKVDEAWFAHARKGDILGFAVKLIPPEEMLWQKSFVMGRQRYDGADIMHIIFSQGNAMDWERLDARFGPDWQILYSHLVMLTYIYPSAGNKVLRDFILKLSRRFIRHMGIKDKGNAVCRGPLLSLVDYVYDRRPAVAGKRTHNKRRDDA